MRVWGPLWPLKSVAVQPGSAASTSMSGQAFAYCVVSIVSAAFDDVQRGAGKVDSTRPSTESSRDGRWMDQR